MPNQATEQAKPRTGLVRIEVGPVDAKVYAPIWAKELIKAMPEREWSPDDRCWIIPAEDASTMRLRFEREDYRVRIVDTVTGHRSPLRLLGPGA